MRMLTGLLLLVALAGSGGCATKIYQGPTSGRGAEAQQAVSMSVERALERFDAKAFKGKRVVVEVYGLTMRIQDESPEETYVRSLLTERLLQAGARVVPAREEAEVLLAATLRSVGVDVIRRDVPFIYHHTTFRGLASLGITGIVLADGVAVRALRSQRLAARSIYRETYVFYVFGPITTRYTEELPDPAAPPERS